MFITDAKVHWGVALFCLGFESVYAKVELFTFRNSDVPLAHIHGFREGKGREGALVAEGLRVQATFATQRF